MPRPEPAAEPLAVPVFDAHTHLDAMAQRAGTAADEAFVGRAMADAAAVGVSAAITVGDSVASSRWCVAAAERSPGVFAAVAVHPTELDGLDDDGYAELERLAGSPRVVAVGETGLDYYWDRTAPDLQQEHFRRHIALAKAVGKALMIHDRDAHSDVLRILREERPPDTVVFHAFSGDSEMARECVRAGYLLSFPGVLTFRNAPALREAAAVVPSAHLLVETDAPFLTPVPYRGRPNASYLVPTTVRAMAEVRGDALEQLCVAIEATTDVAFGGPW